MRLRKSIQLHDQKSLRSAILKPRQHHLVHFRRAVNEPRASRLREIFDAQNYNTYTCWGLQCH